MRANTGEAREAALARAAQCAAEGRTGEAEGILKAVLAKDPGDALLWFRLGSLYLDVEKFMDAIDA